LGRAFFSQELLEQLGDIQLQLREPEEAKESYQKALNLSMNKKLVLKLGKLYLQGKEAAKTEQLFNEYSER
jgi:predicted Zn-dependent protease